MTTGRTIIFDTQQKPAWSRAISEYRDAAKSALTHIQTLKDKTATVGYSFKTQTFSALDADHPNPFEGKEVKEWNKITRDIIVDHAAHLFQNLAKSLATASLIHQNVADFLSQHLRDKQRPRGNEPTQFLPPRIERLFEKIEGKNGKNVLHKDLKAKKQKLNYDFGNACRKHEQECIQVQTTFFVHFNDKTEFAPDTLRTELTQAISDLPQAKELLTSCQTLLDNPTAQTAQQLYEVTTKDVAAMTTLVADLGQDPKMDAYPSLRTFLGIWGKYLASISSLDRKFEPTASAYFASLQGIMTTAGRPPIALPTVHPITLNLCNAFLGAAGKVPLTKLPDSPLLVGPYPNINPCSLSTQIGPEEKPVFVPKAKPALATITPVLPETAPVGREHIYNTQSNVKWQETAERWLHAKKECDYNLWLMWTGTANIGYSDADKKFGPSFPNPFVEHPDMDKAEDLRKNIRTANLQNMVASSLDDLVTHGVVQAAHRDAMRDFFVAKIKSDIDRPGRLEKCLNKIFSQTFKKNQDKQNQKKLKSETENLERNDLHNIPFKADFRAMTKDVLSVPLDWKKIGNEAKTLETTIPGLRGIGTTIHNFASKPNPLDVDTFSTFLNFMGKNENILVPYLEKVGTSSQSEPLLELRKLFYITGHGLKSIHSSHQAFRGIQIQIRDKIKIIEDNHGKAPNVPKAALDIYPELTPKLWESFFLAAAGPNKSVPPEVAHLIPKPQPPNPPPPPPSGPTDPVGKKPPVPGPTPSPTKPTENNKTPAPKPTPSSKQPKKENRLVAWIKKPFIWMKQIFSSLFKWLFK